MMKQTLKIQAEGFTIMEIMIVTIILMALVSLAIPNFLMAVERTKVADGINTLNILFAAQKRYKVYRSGYADALSKLDIEMRPLRGYFAPEVFAPVNETDPIARLRRSDNGVQVHYELTINGGGQILCSAPGTICQKLNL